MAQIEAVTATSNSFVPVIDIAPILRARLKANVESQRSSTMPAVRSASISSSVMASTPD